MNQSLQQNGSRNRNLNRKVQKGEAVYTVRIQTFEYNYALAIFQQKRVRGHLGKETSAFDPDKRIPQTG